MFPADSALLQRSLLRCSHAPSSLSCARTAPVLPVSCPTAVCLIAADCFNVQQTIAFPFPYSPWVRRTGRYSFISATWVIVSFVLKATAVRPSARRAHVPPRLCLSERDTITRGTLGRYCHLLSVPEPSPVRHLSRIFSSSDCFESFGHSNLFQIV